MMRKRRNRPTILQRPQPRLWSDIGTIPDDHLDGRDVLLWAGREVVGRWFNSEWLDGALNGFWIGPDHRRLAGVSGWRNAPKRERRDNARTSGDIKPIAYRINDVATALKVSRRSVYRLVLDGTIRSVKIGGVVLIPADDFDNLVARIAS